MSEKKDPEAIIEGAIYDTLNDWASQYKICEDLPAIAKILTEYIIVCLEDFNYEIIKKDSRSLNPLTAEDALKFKAKIHARCSHCKYYEKGDAITWICYKSTDVWLCELFDPKEIFSRTCESCKHEINPINCFRCNIPDKGFHDYYEPKEKEVEVCQEISLDEPCTKCEKFPKCHLDLFKKQEKREKEKEPLNIAVPDAFFPEEEDDD